MAAQDVKMQDELLPELEISIIPSKLTNNVKVDLFALNDDFIAFLVERGCIDNSPNNDIQHMTMSQVAKFYKTVRNLYRIFNVEAAANADL